MMKKYPEAKQILLQSLKYKESFFVVKWLGQIALSMKDYPKAIYYLEKGRFINSNDAQLLFNLGRPYYHSGKISERDYVLEQLGRLGTNSACFKNLQKLGNTIKGGKFKYSFLKVNFNYKFTINDKVNLNLNLYKK